MGQQEMSAFTRTFGGTTVKRGSDARLTPEEVIACEVASGGRRPPLERIKHLLPGYDGDGDGRLTMAEYKKLHAYLQRGHNVVEEMEDVYAHCRHPVPAASSSCLHAHPPCCAC